MVGASQSQRIFVWSGCFLLMAAGGCGSGPRTIETVNINPDRMTDELMEEYDKNQDDVLSGEELRSVPPLADSLARFDRRGNGHISREELQNGLRRIFHHRAGLLSTVCEVRHNSQPLSGAEVRFVPLPAFQKHLPAGSGVTDSAGITLVSIDLDQMPDNAPKVKGFMRPGLYLVEVTHPSVNIPEKYNLQTTLGKEISVEQNLKGSIVVNLKI